MPPSLAVAVWVVAPVLLAGLTQVVVIKLGWGKSLAALPLDFGLAYQGRRIFGANKTLRGLLVMVGATAFWVFVQHGLFAGRDWAAGLAAPFALAHPLAWGALAGAGYVAGELPNSFIKRRRGIDAGAAAPGAARAVFWVVDQVDSVVGVLVFLYPVWQPSGAVVLALFAVTLLVHPAVALVMFFLGLKARVG